MNVKTFRDVEVKNADTGEVSAVFATLGVVDSDGDVIEPGAVTSGSPVRISAYGHRSWQGALPVGKGTIREDGNELVFDGQFFLSTADGRDTFEVVKEMADLQEWSFSLENMTTERGELDGAEVRFIKQVDVTEVSPVLKGAGINTRTLAVKTDSMRFGEHIDAVTADVDDLLVRAREIVTLRAEKGKTIGDDAASALSDLVGRAKEIEALLAEPEPPAETPDEPEGDAPVGSDVLAREYARFVATSTDTGVTA